MSEPAARAPESPPGALYTLAGGGDQGFQFILALLQAPENLRGLLLIVLDQLRVIVPADLADPVVELHILDGGQQRRLLVEQFLAVAGGENGPFHAVINAGFILENQRPEEICERRQSQQRSE